MAARRHRDDSIFHAAPQGPGWVHATAAVRTYRRRLGFVEYDLAVSAEGRVVTLDDGWRFVGARRPPLVTVVETGWIPRPGRQ